MDIVNVVLAMNQNSVMQLTLSNRGYTRVQTSWLKLQVTETIEDVEHQQQLYKYTK